MLLRPPSEPPERQPGWSLSQLGVVLLLVSISVLFLAATIAVLIARSRVPSWRPPDRHGLPWGVAGSTALLGIVSVELQRALIAIRRNRSASCQTHLRWGSLGAIAFLVVQAWNTRRLFDSEGPQAHRSLFIFSYGLLVGLHALHVASGVVPLGIVLGRVARHDYSSSRHAGLLFCVQYWHYLGVVWLALLAALFWIG
jgi:heme/copper-type cytochrome/quinol oxidase subunit 3